MASAERVAWGLLGAWLCTSCGGSTEQGPPGTNHAGASGSGGDGTAIESSSGTDGRSTNGGSTNSNGGTRADGGTSFNGGGANSNGGANSDGGANSAGNASGGQGGHVASGGSSTACGSAGGGGIAPNSSADPDEGTVTPIWDSFCFATFSCNYTTLSLEGPALTARAGRDYLITSFGGNSAKLAYLTPGGPVSFMVKAGEGGFPFTSNCEPDTLKMYTAVFNDLTVFAEPSLRTKLCELKAGTTALLDDTKPNGFFLQSINDTDSVYKIVLNTLSDRCSGAEEGYIAVPAFMVLGASLFLVPFNFLEAPP